MNAQMFSDVEKDNIRVTVNFQGEELVCATVPWPIDYHAEDVEETVRKVSDNVIALALAKISIVHPELHEKLESVVQSDDVSYRIDILKNMWGTRYDNVYNNVDVGIF